MTVQHKFSSIAFLSIVGMLLSACGAAPNQSALATKVAMTVRAEDALTASAASAATVPPPTGLPQLPTLSLSPAATEAGATKAPPTPPAAGNNQCTASASFVSETIPDGTITSPGSVFTKVWRIKNTGTCTWTTSWQWVYISGDLLGGAYYYNFPSPAAPGDTVDVPVVFTAPADGGSYRGYWKIKSPWGLVFGDSDSGNAFWVDILVGSGTPGNNKTQTAYGITDVTIDITRRCTTANTFYDITAHISSNGPLTAVFTWNQSDGNEDPNNRITFTQAMTKDVNREWSQSISSSTKPRWIQVVITSPSYKEYPPVTLPQLCNQ
jgi:hypothetical protein